MAAFKTYNAEEEAERAANAAKADAMAEVARKELIALSLGTAGLPPLPPGWTEHPDAASGKSYYHNLVLGQTVWERPAPPPAPEGAKAAPKLPQRRQSALAGMGVLEGISPRDAAEGGGGAAEGEGEGYSVSAKASNKVSDLMAADAGDESLRKYKESLLGAAARGDLGDTKDSRRLVVTEFRVLFEDPLAPPAVFNLSTPAGMEALKTDGLTIKEGANFKFQLSFRVNHELLEGLKFVNKTKRAVVGQTDELMIGSYAPATAPHVFTFPRYGWNECPKGMMYRGKYSSSDSFVDSNGVTHAEYSYPLVIGKGWK